jgi:hypothetical protein
LVTNAHHHQGLALKAAALRHMGQVDLARKVIDVALALDPISHWAHSELALLTKDKKELTRILRGDVQTISTWLRLR